MTRDVLRAVWCGCAPLPDTTADVIAVSAWCAAPEAMRGVASRASEDDARGLRVIADAIERHRNALVLMMAVGAVNRAHQSMDRAGPLAWHEASCVSKASGALERSSEEAALWSIRYYIEAHTDRAAACDRVAQWLAPMTPLAYCQALYAALPVQWWCEARVRAEGYDIYAHPTRMDSLNPTPGLDMPAAVAPAWRRLPEHGCYVIHKPALWHVDAARDAAALLECAR